MTPSSRIPFKERPGGDGFPLSFRLKGEILREVIPGSDPGSIPSANPFLDAGSGSGMTSTPLAPSLQSGSGRR